MDAFEIYLMKYPFNGCYDARPWLIIEFNFSSPLIGCFPITTESYDGTGFFVSATHPDFAATGLDHDSYIRDSHLVEVPGDSVIKRQGELVGDLLAEFREFAGLSNCPKVL